MLVQVIEENFNAWERLQIYEKSQDFNGKCGATSVFVGTMRDFNEGEQVQNLFLEHYPEMTQRYLEKIAQETFKQWDILDVLIIHRVGEIKIDEQIVLTAAWSAHRSEAFAACRYLIEELKHRAPFWKRETLSNQTRWVSSNTPA